MTTDLSGTGKLKDELRNLVNLVDDLRDCGLNKIIKLPSICVVGGQSAGKSSVLEQIVGIDFLPRAAGICTRRPLELRLIHEQRDIKPYAVFEEIKDRKFEDFQEVKKHIEMLTDKIAGNNKNIVDKPILLTIYSKTCPDLTLIDLPGITKVPLRNSGQTEDIERITKDMVTRQIQEEKTIILVVVPANQDVSTSDGLQLAKQIDPDGKRTIGVVTKIDIMDRGTDAKRLLMGEDIQLKLGWVGIVNRSQKDINDELRVKVALENERNYFASTPPQNSMPHGYLCTDVLVEKLTQCLQSQIKHFLPEIVRELNGKSTLCENRLNEIGPGVPVTDTERMQLLNRLITEFCESYKDNLSGKYDRRIIHYDKKAKPSDSSSKIKEIFHNLLLNYSENQSVTSDYQDKDIEISVKLHGGDSIPGFPSPDVFVSLIYPKLMEISEPCMDCLNDVQYLIEQMTETTIKKIFLRFPTIATEILDLALELINIEKDKTKHMIENIVDSDLNQIFTSDWEFLMKNSNVIHNDEEKGNSVFIREIRVRLDNYFAIIVRNIRDTVPKIIGQHLVKKSQESMSFNFWQRINNDRQDIIEMMAEPDRFQLERESLAKQLKILKNSIKVIKKDPQLSRMLGQANTERSLGRTPNKLDGMPSQARQPGYNQSQMPQQGNPNASVRGGMDPNQSMQPNNQPMPSNSGPNPMQNNYPSNQNPNYNQNQNQPRGGIDMGGNNQNQPKSKPKLILFKQENKE